MSTYVVMFHARSRPSDEGKEGGGGRGDHPVPEIREGRGPLP